MTRRTLFKCAASGVFANALLARGQQSSAEARKPLDTLPGAEKNRKLKVVLVGAHVDDWIFCVGTLARYAREGHEVLCFSFTPGDSQGMANGRHMSVDKLAAIRREDAMKGTKLFGAQFKILDQYNQKMHVDPEAYIEFNKTLAAENPDVVFGLWPLQFHPDHRAAGNLAFNAWLQSGNKFDFYFCETYLASEETAQQFAPNRWVDVESVLDISRQAIMGNTLEDTKAICADYETCARFRGAEYGCQYAEAFVHIVTVGSVKVPPNPVPGLWYSGLDAAHDE
jgi:LmbE family N-acetylglucosaminyl deacetylase